jgi:hypothetical protein
MDVFIQVAILTVSIGINAFNSPRRRRIFNALAVLFRVKRTASPVLGPRQWIHLLRDREWLHASPSCEQGLGQLMIGELIDRDLIGILGK